MYKSYIYDKSTIIVPCYRRYNIVIFYKPKNPLSLDFLVVISQKIHKLIHFSSGATYFHHPDDYFNKNNMDCLFLSCLFPYDNRHFLLPFIANIPLFFLINASVFL